MPMATPEEQREYQRQWVAKRRATWFAENGPCVRCGTWDDLQLDHIDRTTKIHHVIWSWSSARRNAEIAKCQVLCQLCHLQKSKEYREGQYTRLVVDHGSKTMYDSHGCRCDLCRKAASAYKAAWRARTGKR